MLAGVGLTRGRKKERPDAVAAVVRQSGRGGAARQPGGCPVEGDRQDR
jgi:hypothetical protein